ncbi:hypothetical protein ACFQ07_23450, partial [Actinomadura adrarensis]
ADAQRRLRYLDLRFVPGAPSGTGAPPDTGDPSDTSDPSDTVEPSTPQGGHRIGQVGDQDRYVVVTQAVSAGDAGSAEKAKNAFVLLHGPTLNVIVWF